MGNKLFNLETGTVATSESTSAEQMVKISIAVSLKRIADAMESKSEHRSLFEEVFGKK